MDPLAMPREIALAISICACFIVAWALVHLQTRFAGLIGKRKDAFAVQSSHSGEPLRLGGVAVLLGLGLGLAVSGTENQTFALFYLVLSVLPVFLAGVAEDLGYSVSPLRRFAAAMISALLATALLLAWAPRADLPYLDRAMQIEGVAILMTVIFTAGFCHAVNLIDGMNGLAATVIISSGIGGAIVASLADQSDIGFFLMLLSGSMLGFLFLNWPRARLFMGDAGAYGVGHLVIWAMILLAWRAEQVAVPALLLIVFWPIADVVHTIIRRVLEQTSILHPDRMHLHQKVRRMLDIVWFGYNRRQRSNPLTTVILLPMIVAPIIAGVLLWNQPVKAWVAFGLFFLLFSAAHPLTTYAARKYRS